MPKIFRTILLLMASVPLFLILSCQRDVIDTDPSLKLGFSVDTVMFDTVFTTVGSSTRRFTVHNNHKQKVSISSIRLANGDNSFFRLNIDGQAANQAKDIEIEANDSIFIFVEVTVDPTQQDLPLIITDSIVFNLNGNQQDVKLVAWGQDAHFVLPNSFIIVDKDTVPCHVITNDTIWSANKPHVIYGLCLLYQDVTLTIEQGAKIHFHKGASMLAYTGASFKVYGSLENPVVFQGDRLEPFYREISGQWGGIYLLSTSKNHVFENTLIKNGTIGIQVDSVGSLTEPTLTIKNTVIRNMKYYGLEAQGSNVKAENLMVNNCEESALILQLGGEYEFLHCTFANYNNTSIRKSASFKFNNYYIDTAGTVQIRDLTKAYFGNCVLTGGLQEELIYDNYASGGVFNLVFDHCLLKTQKNTEGSQYINILKNIDPKFKDIEANDFKPKADSPLIGAGKAEITLQVPVDLFGVDRGGRPDLGAIQYVEEEEE
ncbi:MAG: right-handed parallel beta-helix repeat-containing protein [Bacteroidales bacterium]|nr:right-handed parallel beta-helix repeat-containing protein [Bacteroidales bacterium]